MSWLAPRKSGDRVISWEYRWNDRGLTKSRSTGTNDHALAKKIQKKWDAAAILGGSEVLTGARKTTDLSIVGQLALWLKEKKIDVKPSTYRRYEFHAGKGYWAIAARYARIFRPGKGREIMRMLT